MGYYTHRSTQFRMVKAGLILTLHSRDIWLWEIRMLPDTPLSNIGGADPLEITVDHFRPVQ